MNKANRQNDNGNKRTWTRAVRTLAVPAALVPLIFMSGSATAATTYDRADVVSVHPVYETVAFSTPVEQCHEERVAYRSGRASATGPILGAIIGGAIGNAVGHKKRNKQVGTAVGALLGGSIGADVSRRNRYGERVSYRTEEVCDVVHETREEERLMGYDVSYVYGGTTYRTRMNRHPGDTLRVRVRVSPAE